MANSLSQSTERPNNFNCDFIWAIFCLVHLSGFIPLSIAAFSAGKPNASQPIGCNTTLPWNLWNRAIKSVIT